VRVVIAAFWRVNRALDNLLRVIIERVRRRV
jgi:hypothetical protein